MRRVLVLAVLLLFVSSLVLAQQVVDADIVHFPESPTKCISFDEDGTGGKTELFVDDNCDNVKDATESYVAPGSDDTHVQFNDGGVFGGESTFTYTKGTDLLKVDNMTNAGSGHLDIIGQLDVSGVVGLAGFSPSLAYGVTASMTSGNAGKYGAFFQVIQSNSSGNWIGYGVATAAQYQSTSAGAPVLYGGRFVNTMYTNSVTNGKLFGGHFLVQGRAGFTGTADEVTGGLFEVWSAEYVANNAYLAKFQYTPGTHATASLGGLYGIHMGDLTETSVGTDPTTVDAIFIETQDGANQDFDHGNIRFASGDCDEGHIQLGNDHIWSDGTTIYGSIGAPSNCTDGTDLMGAGGGGGSANYSQSFTTQTSVTLTHNLGTKNVLVFCYDSTDIWLGPDDIDIDAADPWDVVVTFTESETGRCIVNGSGTAGRYTESFSAQTTVTVTGATHGLGTNMLSVDCYDNSDPRERVGPNTVTVDDGTNDVVITFIESETGKCVLQ